MWDGKTGEALTTLTSERLLENDQADITAFSLDHQVCSPSMKNVESCWVESTRRLLWGHLTPSRIMLQYHSMAKYPVR